MSDIAIRVENLSKLYHIGRARQRHDTLRDALSAALHPASRAARREDETLWALRDVSFEVQRGEVVGIIGRNGAGKSTLLKILSRITEPTSGRAEIHGRVGSLLEVGTGFHPELTGRENIYLNGAILGMHRTEIDRKFDEIVAFAEIEKFLDTPVKHYSSGMYVRLAFAVAAHLEPQILLIDEVLAVGDTAFQTKCLGKMGDVAHEGRTVLFISHNLAAIEAICQRGIVLSQGSVIKDDSSLSAVRMYMELHRELSDRNIASRQDREGQGKTRLTDVQVHAGAAQGDGQIRTGQPVRFIFTFSRLLPHMSSRFTLYDLHGTAVVHFNSDVAGPRDSVDLTAGPRHICDVDGLVLAPGRYFGNVAVYDRSGLQDRVESAMVLEVVPGVVHGRRVSPDAGYGLTFLDHSWRLGICE